MAQWIFSLSLRKGRIRTSLTARMSLFKGAAETVRLGADFDDVRIRNLDE
jgi:hypothetical protein